MIRTYLINYTPFTQRLEDTKLALYNAGVDLSNVVVVNTWDREELSPHFVSATKSVHWMQGLELIGHILIRNSMSAQMMDDQLSKNLFTCQDISGFPWLQPRELSLGEISVVNGGYS